LKNCGRTELHSVSSVSLRRRLYCTPARTNSSTQMSLVSPLDTSRPPPVLENKNIFTRLPCASPTRQNGKVTVSSMPSPARLSLRQLHVMSLFPTLVGAFFQVREGPPLFLWTLMCSSAVLSAPTPLPIDNLAPQKTFFPRPALRPVDEAHSISSFLLLSEKNIWRNHEPVLVHRLPPSPRNTDFQ